MSESPGGIDCRFSIGAEKTKHVLARAKAQRPRCWKQSMAVARSRNDWMRMSGHSWSTRAVVPSPRPGFGITGILVLSIPQRLTSTNPSPATLSTDESQVEQIINSRTP